MESSVYQGVKVYAFESEKEDFSDVLLCECCAQEVSFKKGNIKRPHFAHKSTSPCLFKENESEEHIEIKTSIFKGLRKYGFVENLVMEKFLGDCISDIYFEKNGLKYAVEIQLSEQTEAKIIERNAKYYEKGIHVIWVHSYKRFLERIDLSSKIVSLKSWERWLAAMNYGYLFLHMRDEAILPVKLSKASYLSHRERKVASGSIKSLAKDFFGVEKEAWEKFPALKIFQFRK